MSEPVEQAVEQDAQQAAEQTDLTSEDIEQAPTSVGASPGQPTVTAQLAGLQSLVAERTEDLQRVQAEYVNYKRRVDRDRTLARQSGIEAVLRELMPVFDSIHAAEEHGELTGGFKLTADELKKVTSSFGFESFGAPGDEFDPRLHEALMQMPEPDVDTMSVRDVMQVGYRIGDLVIRPARVVVAVPAE